MSASGGSLSAAATALIGLPNAWAPLAKLRTPLDYLIATARGVGALGTVAPAIGADLNSLNQPLWLPPFPNGWSDLGVDWASPAQLMLRTNFVNDFCNAYGRLDPTATANKVLGDLLNPATSSAMGQVTSAHDKLTILFCSPEFMRR